MHELSVLVDGFEQRPARIVRRPVLRFFGSSVLRFFGSSVLRFFGSSVLRFFGSSVLRFFFMFALRHSRPQCTFVPLWRLSLQCFLVPTAYFGRKPTRRNGIVYISKLAYLVSKYNTS
jgi:hypothetical protein